MLPMGTIAQGVTSTSRILQLRDMLVLVQKPVYNIHVPYLVFPISLQLLPALTQLFTVCTTVSLHPGTDSMQRS